MLNIFKNSFIICWKFIFNYLFKIKLNNFWISYLLYIISFYGLLWFFIFYFFYLFYINYFILLNDFLTYYKFTKSITISNFHTDYILGIYNDVFTYGIFPIFTFYFQLLTYIAPIAWLHPIFFHIYVFANNYITYMWINWATTLYYILITCSEQFGQTHTIYLNNPISFFYVIDHFLCFNYITSYYNDLYNIWDIMLNIYLNFVNLFNFSLISIILLLLSCHIFFSLNHIFKDYIRDINNSLYLFYFYLFIYLFIRIIFFIFCLNLIWNWDYFCFFLLIIMCLISILHIKKNIFNNFLNYFFNAFLTLIIYIYILYIYFFSNFFYFGILWQLTYIFIMDFIAFFITLFDYFNWFIKSFYFLLDNVYVLCIMQIKLFLFEFLINIINFCYICY